MKRRVFLLAFLVVLLTLVPATPALAYIDPATTTYIIQVATALIITLGVSLSIFFYRFQMVITNARVYLHALSRRFSRQKSEPVPSGPSPEPFVDMSALQTEEEALAAGVIDYPVPVRKNYPAIACAPLAEKVIAPTTKAEAAEAAEPTEPAEPAEPTSKKAPTKKGLKALLKALGHWLWDDKRSFKNRLSKAALLSAAITMTYGLFNMLELLIANKGKFFFTFADAIGSVLVFSLIMFVILTLILISVRGRIFDLAVCMAFSFLVCGYLQNTFFNTGIGELTGQLLSWDYFGVQSVIINLSIWIIVLTVVLLLGLVRRPRIQQVFKWLFLFVPSLLIVVQAIALLSILPPIEEWQGGKKTASALVLSREDLYTVSAENNVIVIVVDTMDEAYVNQLTNEDPSFFDNLDGFVRFTNCVSVYSKTYPSMVNLFTNAPLDNSVPYDVYFENAYAQRSFLSDIREQGFISNLYVEKPHVYLEERQLEGLADNVKDGEFSLITWKIPLQLFRFSLIKELPLAFKGMDWLFPDMSYWGIGTWTSGSMPYWAEDPLFYKELKDKGLSTTDEPLFILIHMSGFHLPFTMDSKAQFVEGGVSPIEQYKGSFFIVNEYLSQLKELGLYKDATIIIIGDHAEHTGHMEIDRPMLIGCFVKPSGEEGTPLRYSNAPVSIQCLRATSVEAAGGDPTPWGRTFFEFGEDEVIERYYYHRYTDGSGKHYMSCYRIVGDANDWANWELFDLVLVDPKNWW